MSGVVYVLVVALILVLMFLFVVPALGLFGWILLGVALVIAVAGAANRGRW